RLRGASRGPSEQQRGRNDGGSHGAQKAAPGLTPKRLRMRASGQNPVNDACSRFRPTKALSQYQFWFTDQPSARPSRTTVPANLITMRSIVISDSSAMIISSITVLEIANVVNIEIECRLCEEHRRDRWRRDAIGPACPTRKRRKR